MKGWREGEKLSFWKASEIDKNDLLELNAPILSLYAGEHSWGKSLLESQSNPSIYGLLERPLVAFLRLRRLV